MPNLPDIYYQSFKLWAMIELTCSNLLGNFADTDDARVLPAMTASQGL